MREDRLFPEGTVPEVSTYDWHKDRGRARHLEQANHHDRIMTAVAFIHDVYKLNDRKLTVSDLGCGDGGLLSLIQPWTGVSCWGYDFTPANVMGGRDRGVSVIWADVFGTDRENIRFGECTVMTEVLEHLADPHGALRWVAEHSRWLVCSSPWDEHKDSHDECHAWAWDHEGYLRMLADSGWLMVQATSLRYKFQVVLARRFSDAYSTS